MIRVRVRMRFRKQDELRLISHHDLLRTFERWLRRAGLPLRRSEGFHPKPKLSFPLAMALGIAGLDEVGIETRSKGLPACRVEVNHVTTRTKLYCGGARRAPGR